MMPRSLSLSWAALMLVVNPLHAEDYVLHAFKKIQLSDKFWSDSGAIGDINRDGRNDVVSGPYWYQGPDFKLRHEFYPATQAFSIKGADGTKKVIEGFDGALGSGETLTETDSQFSSVVDLNNDGWPDILFVGQLSDGTGRTFLSSRILSWYENPGKDGLKGNKHWTRHIVADRVDNQSIDFVPLLGNGKPVLIGMSDGYAGYFSPDPSDAALPWKFHAISPRVLEYAWHTHGLGYGDINGDGRNDLLVADGWWEQPASLVNDPIWSYHPYPFNLGPNQIKQSLLKGALPYEIGADGIPKRVAGQYGGSQMTVHDVNGDGLPDVVTSLAAHGYGLVWWEQLQERDRDGSIQFKRHLIINQAPSENQYGVSFSEMQAVALFDMDGDGLADIVTGKCFWRHGNGVKFKMDPESNFPAVLYWFRQVRNADNSVEFVPYLIDDNSGAGNQIAIGDINGDNKPDIVVGNKKGSFAFLQEVRNVNKEQWEKAQPKVLFPKAASVDKP